MKYKTEEELLESMLLKAQERELISTSEDLVDAVMNGQQTENQYVLDLATHAFILAEFNRNLEDMYDSFDITKANGQQLDRLGHLVNVPRLPAMPAKVEIQLSLEIPYDNNFEIPAGTKLIIDPIQLPDYISYYTDTTVTIEAGVTNATVMCSSDMLAVQPRLPVDVVHGLEGYPDFTVTNYDHGTTGKNLEEDSDYRQRILLWNVQNQRGSRAAFEAYLGSYPGIDDYKLIPRENGPGTLTVVCDCIESMRYDIEEGLRDECMLFTDEPPLVVMPTPEDIDIDVEVVVNPDLLNVTSEELRMMIEGQIRVYFAGGVNRNGVATRGLGIGEAFIPSRFIMFLHNVFPELLSVTCNTLEDSVDDYHRFRPGFITVEVS